MIDKGEHYGQVVLARVYRLDGMREWTCITSSALTRLEKFARNMFSV